MSQTCKSYSKHTAIVSLISDARLFQGGYRCCYYRPSPCISGLPGCKASFPFNWVQQFVSWENIESQITVDQLWCISDKIILISLYQTFWTKCFKFYTSICFEIEVTDVILWMYTQQWTSDERQSLVFAACQLHQLIAIHEHEGSRLSLPLYHMCIVH